MNDNFTHSGLNGPHDNSPDALAASYPVLADSIRGDLLLGKNDREGTRNYIDDLADPILAGEQVVSKWRSSASSLLDACELIHEGCSRYGSKPAFDQFLGVLVEGGVLSAADIRPGVSASKLSMLLAIGANAGWLRQSQMLKQLGDGYSVAYQLTLLHREWADSGADPQVEVEAFLASRSGPITRADIASERKRVKQANTAPNTTAAAQASTATLRGNIVADLVLVTPGRGDLATLREKYPDPSAVANHLNLAGMVNERPALLVSAPMKDLASIESRLLPAFGHAKAATILLQRRPDGPNITDAVALMIATSQSMQQASIPATWDQEAVSEHVLAERLFPQAKGRLHLFADRSPDGWTSIPRNQSWVAEPSLR